MADHVPSSPRCRADLAVTRRGEATRTSSVWAHKSEAAIQAKEEAIRHAINTVSLTSVFKSPMSLAETERQKTLRRQERFMELYRAAAKQSNDTKETQTKGSAASGSCDRHAAAHAANKTTRSRLAATPVTAVDGCGVSNAAGEVSATSQHRKQEQDFLLLQSRRSGCDGEPAATGSSISRPNTARIPPAASSLVHRDGGRRTGWFRGGGGPTSFAAVAQTSRFASLHGGGSGCNGTYRSSSALDNKDVPLYSSFSADGVFHASAKDDVQQLVTHFRRSASAVPPRPPSASYRYGSSTTTNNSSAFSTVAAPTARPPPSQPQSFSVVESTRQEQRDALHELHLLEEALGQPGTDARRSFWKRAATPISAATAAPADPQKEPQAASPPPRSLYSRPTDPPSGAGMYLPMRPTSAPYHVTFRSPGGVGCHQHSGRRGFGDTASTAAGGGSENSPQADPLSPLEGSPVSDEVDLGADVTVSSGGGGVVSPRRPSVFSLLAESLRALPPTNNTLLLPVPHVGPRDANHDGDDDDGMDLSAPQPELVSSSSPSYSGVYNRANLFRPRTSVVSGSGRHGESPSGSSGTFVTSLDDALRISGN